MYECGLGISYYLDVEDCLVIPLSQTWELEYSPLIFMVIIVTTAVKVIVIICMMRLGAGQLSPLLMAGDAVASYLTRPDPTTVGICWMTRVGLGDKTSSWRTRKHAASRGENQAALSMIKHHQVLAMGHCYNSASQVCLRRLRIAPMGPDESLARILATLA
jgi:hypothetical protein